MVKKTKLVRNAKNQNRDYVSVLSEIKEQIEISKVGAFCAINKALNKRNWIIGGIITQKLKTHDYDSNILEELAQDLQNMYPGNSGLSPANIYRMKAFYEAYEEIRTAVRKFEELPIFSIGWGQNILLLQKLKSLEKRLWYAQKTLDNDWSKITLEKQIKSDLYAREGKAISNFKQTLMQPYSTMAQEAFKDPYIFDFLKLQDDHLEYDLENGLINNVQKLLLEMGKGFALVGRQHHLQVGAKDYYVDLLFYHIKLKCYVVVELKSCEFIPEHAGKLNFYLSAIDNQLRGPEDKPTIGLLLCKTKDNFTAEYALMDINKPIGIAEYETEIIRKLPKDLKRNLPTVEEIEAEFEKNELLEEKIARKS